MPDNTGAATFGLPPCLHIPIAASGVAAIVRYVGAVLAVEGRRDDGQPNALCVASGSRNVNRHPRVKLWQHARAAQYFDRLHPLMQVWVDVDYGGYRDAYQRFRKKLPLQPIPAGYFLDHVRNRKAIRLRRYSHRYLRLCPVSRAVNTSGGSAFGGEGLEKDFLSSLTELSQATRRQIESSLRAHPIIYADPMDLTKMLDIPPGTQALAGVAATQSFFYPPADLNTL